MLSPAALRGAARSHAAPSPRPHGDALRAAERGTAPPTAWPKVTRWGWWQSGDASLSSPAAAWQGCPSLPVPEVRSRLISPPNFVSAPRLPLRPRRISPLALGGPPTAACAAAGAARQAARLKGRARAAGVWGGRPPLPPPHAPWSPAAGSPITWEFSHVTGGGCAVVPGAVGCLWWGRGYIHPCWQLSARAGTPSA